MMTNGTGTNGGWRGINGAQRRLALLFGAGFLLILAAIMIANATSMVSDFAAAHIPVTPAHIWLFEVTSIIAWISEMPVIWWMVVRLRRASPRWWGVALIIAAATVPASAWHIGLMVVLRIAVYAMQSEHYRFTVGGDNPWLYEYRKDVGTFLQFAALALVAQWLITRAATPSAVLSRMIDVNDGAVTHRVPVDEITTATSAGNYVEIAWGQRVLLQRATLGAIEQALGPGFVRIHRSRLVRREAIRRIETDKSGDFTVELADGTALRGSRRYRIA